MFAASGMACDHFILFSYNNKEVDNPLDHPAIEKSSPSTVQVDSVGMGVENPEQANDDDEYDSNMGDIKIPVTESSQRVTTPVIAAADPSIRPAQVHFEPPVSLPPLVIQAPSPASPFSNNKFPDTPHHIPRSIPRPANHKGSSIAGLIARVGRSLPAVIPRQLVAKGRRGKALKLKTVRQSIITYHLPILM